MHIIYVASLPFTLACGPSQSAAAQVNRLGTATDGAKLAMGASASGFFRFPAARREWMIIWLVASVVADQTKLHQGEYENERHAESRVGDAQSEDTKQGYRCGE